MKCIPLSCSKVSSFVSSFSPIKYFNPPFSISVWGSKEFISGTNNCMFHITNMYILHYMHYMCYNTQFTCITLHTLHVLHYTIYMYHYMHYMCYITQLTCISLHALHACYRQSLGPDLNIYESWLRYCYQMLSTGTQPWGSGFKVIMSLPFLQSLLPSILWVSV